MIDLNGSLRVLPIVEPDISHTIGIVVSEHFPIQPAVAALLDEARALARRGLLPAA